MRFIVLLLALISTPALAQYSNAGGAQSVVLRDAVTGAPIGDANGTATQGNVASGSADAGRPVKIGGVANSTSPALADGQRGDAQMTNRGSLKVTLFDTSLTPVGVLSGSTDANSTGNAGLVVLSFNSVFNGTSWDRVRGDTNGIAVQPALSATFWNYAPPVGGIVNSTVGVTVKAAAGAGVRNYISVMQIDSDTLGAASELVIRDGAAGTVLWRGKLQTAASGRFVKFDPPLRGSPNTLVEVATLTATVSGSVLLNLQGYTGN